MRRFSPSWFLSPAFDSPCKMSDLLDLEAAESSDENLSEDEDGGGRSVTPSKKKAKAVISSDEEEEEEDDEEKAREEMKGFIAVSDCVLSNIE